MDNPFRVEIALSWDAVSARWERLQSQGSFTPFQHAHWISTWYASFGALPHVQPLIVVVSDTRTDLDVLLIPLVRRAVGQLRTIEFADLWTTDYNAPLIGAHTPTTELDSTLLWEAVRKALPDADLVRFTKMPRDIMQRQNPLTLLKGARASEVSGHIIQFPENWDDYLKSLKKDVQSLQRRRWKRLTEEAKASFLWVEQESEAKRVLATLHAQQCARLRNLNVRHVFDSPHYIRFYERHVLDGLADGTAVLTALQADGEILATFLAVANGHCCTLIRSSQLWDERWLKFGLGKLIIGRSMQALHERGYRQFDLSIGDFSYKHDFRVASVQLYDLDIALTWRARPILMRDRTWAVVRRNPRAAALVRLMKRFLTSRPVPAEIGS